MIYDCMPYSVEMRSFQDGLVAKHDRQEVKGEAGTYHFLHLYDVPEVDDNLKDGIGTGEVSLKYYPEHE